MSTPTRFSSITILALVASCLLFACRASAQGPEYFRITWKDLHTILDDDLDGQVTTDELSDLRKVRTLILKLIDKDRDGVMSADELIGIPELLSAADTDVSESVSRKELDAWLREWREQVGGPKRSKSAATISLQELLDTNDDGILTVADLTDITAAWQLVDDNDDGFLSPSELKDVEEPLGKADSDSNDLVSVDEMITWLIASRVSVDQIVLADVLDVDGDGTLTVSDLADITAAWESILEALDDNGDEFLSPSEIKKVKEPINEADLDADQLITVDELIDWLIAWRQQLSQVRLTALLDLNGDGVMGANDLQDIGVAWETMLAVLDTNDDEFLSESELFTVAEPLRHPDLDKDGLATVDELVDWLTAWRERLPGSKEKVAAARNGTAKTPKEPAAKTPKKPASPTPRGSRLTALLDYDGDQIVSAADLADLGRAWETILKGLDKNSDEFLSKDELQGITEPIGAADLDADDLITVDELIDWLMVWREDLQKTGGNRQQRR